MITEDMPYPSGKPLTEDAKEADPKKQKRQKPSPADDEDDDQ
jgi:hypothetical protein